LTHTGTLLGTFSSYSPLFGSGSLGVGIFQGGVVLWVI